MWFGVTVMGILWFLYHFTPVLDFIPAIEFLKIQVLGAVLILVGLYLNYNFGDIIQTRVHGSKNKEDVTQ